MLNHSTVENMTFHHNELYCGYCPLTVTLSTSLTMVLISLPLLNQDRHARYLGYFKYYF